MVAKAGFQIGFADGVRFGNLQKLEHKRVPQQIGRLRHELPLLGELEDGVFVFPCCQSQEQGGFHLPLQLRNRPFVVDCLFLVKAALQRVIQLQQFHKMRPA